MTKVFISHSASDRRFVEDEILPPLKEGGLECWYSPNDIKSTAQWEREILHGLQESDWFLVVISPNSVASRWVKAEVDWAMEHRIGWIAPVLLGQTNPMDLHLMLPQIQQIDFTCDALQGRRQLQEWVQEAGRTRLEDRPVVIAVMGTKGGIGKSTIITAMAQLIASAGRNVAIIDTDLETGGVTAYLGGWAKRKTPVWSLLDAAYARHPGAVAKEGDEAVAWDVTPASLRGEARFGSLFLVPSRLPNDTRSGYPAVADLPERAASALGILREMLERLSKLPERVDYVLVDCGAENNPMVSAAFVLARYGYLVSHPNPEFARAIPRLEAMHRETFPGYAITPMTVIVNMVPQKMVQQLGSRPSMYWIPLDLMMGEVSADGRPIDFLESFKGIGLNRFYLAVLKVLHGTLVDARDQAMLPDEVAVWVRPYLEAMKDFPEKLLCRARYRLASLILLAFLVAGLGLSAIAGTCYYLGISASNEVVSTVDVPGEVERLTDAELGRRWSEVSLPPEMSKRVILSGRQLIVRGSLASAELEQLKLAGIPQPILYAALEASRNNQIQQNVVTDQRQQRQRLFLVLISVGLMIAGVGMWFDQATRKRKRLLQQLILGRSDVEKMAMFLRRMLQAEEGRPQLNWLREEFRKASPLLLE